MLSNQVAAEDKRFYMVGVIHRDEKGAHLLSKWVETIKPEVITLEFSSYGMTFRKERGRELRKRIENTVEVLRKSHIPSPSESLSPLYSFVDMPYEYEVTRKYCEEYTIPLYLIDMDMFSYLKLRKIEELLSPDNIREILLKPEKNDTQTEKALAKMFFERGIKIPYTEEMYIRDRYMSEKIGLLMKYHKNKRFLHVCGWRHLQDPYKLYSKLNPIKVFFYDKTLCV